MNRPRGACECGRYGCVRKGPGWAEWKDLGSGEVLRVTEDGTQYQCLGCETVLSYRGFRRNYRPAKPEARQ